MTSSTKITDKSLKDLGLYSAWDVSKWCQSQGIQSVYLEHHKERIMEVQWVYMNSPCWIVRDSRYPGRVIKKFVLKGNATLMETRKVAEAWVEETYDTPMKFLPSVHSAFPAPAVDLLLAELDNLYRVWGPDIITLPKSTGRKVVAKELIKETV